MILVNHPGKSLLPENVSLRISLCLVTLYLPFLLILPNHLTVEVVFCSQNDILIFHSG
jgi:hypothetical protein